MRISDWSSDVCSSDLAAAGYEKRLLRLPSFMRHDDPDAAAPDPTMADILDFLAITGHFLARDVLDGRNRDLLTSRERSEERRVGKECVSTCRSRWSPDH